MTTIIVCGGRDYAHAARLNWALDYWHARLEISLLVQGGQMTIHPEDRRLPAAEQRRYGADYLAKRWAMARGVPWVEEAVSDADWKKLGKSAGPIRNTRMLIKHRPQKVIAFKGGAGTADMVDQARRAGVKVIEVA